MKKFLKLLSLFLLPLFILFFPYIAGDPFMVLRKYKVYYSYDEKEPLYINNNRGYVSTQMYLQYNDTYHWNSFIFGNSRSGYYRTDDWKKHLDSSARCFHFDGYGESLYNIYKKITFLDQKSELDNVILCLDNQTLYQCDPESGHLWVTTPVLEDGRNWSDWNMAFIKAYSQPSFFKAYIDFSITHKVKPYMVKSGVIDTMPHGRYTLATNEVDAHPVLVYPQFDSSWFTPERVSIFFERPDSIEYYRRSIGTKQKKMLSEIADIFKRNNTNYKVILSPDYDQKLYAPEDIEFLRHTFGDNLYDFSGRNKITQDYHNYFDLLHYSSEVASEIMRIIYLDRQDYLAAMDSLYTL